MVNMCSNVKESGIGLPHSKTLARIQAGPFVREVLECGSPMPLLPKLHRPPNTFSRTVTKEMS